MSEAFRRVVSWDCSPPSLPSPRLPSNVPHYAISSAGELSPIRLRLTKTDVSLLRRAMDYTAGPSQNAQCHAFGNWGTKCATLCLHRVSTATACSGGMSARYHALTLQARHFPRPDTCYQWPHLKVSGYSQPTPQLVTTRCTAAPLLSRTARPRTQTVFSICSLIFAAFKSR